ncbi:MAG TPA: hypothetical protein VHY08_24500 [Bacillota bacterium]|nr:hypothetical protein [Bacillota bacterium]
MSNFGFVSPLLAPGRHPAWKSLMALFPGWANFFPVHTKAVGAITGSLFDMPVRGYGFSTPEIQTPAWSESRLALFWDRFSKELRQREITVVGMDGGTPQPPSQIIDASDFPGVSDGKALELFLFNQNFLPNPGPLRNNAP